MFEDLNYTPMSVVQRDRRHGNPQQQKLYKARMQAMDWSPVTKPDNRLLRSKVWEPLAGSKPVDLEHRTGCAWCVTNAYPKLFCNEPTEHGSYCREHAAMMRSKEKSE